MSKVCQVTGKKPSRGFKYTIRGITGKTKRRFRPNLVVKKLWYGTENRFITLRLSTAALRTIDKNGIDSVVRGMRARGESV
jgi:large subunit ribosomal protein L28